MTNRAVTKVVFPLWTSGTWSIDTKTNSFEIERHLKNAMLYFDTICVERGIRSIAYADTFVNDWRSPYGRDRYLEWKQLQQKAGSAKTQHWIAFKPEWIPDAKYEPIAASLGRTFHISLEGVLDDIRGNFSPQELSFIHEVSLREDLQETQQMISKIKSDTFWESNQQGMSQGLEEICDAFDIGKFGAQHILEETNMGMFLSRVFEGTLVADSLHQPIVALKYSSLTKESFNASALSPIMNALIPDYSKLTIEKIVELRKNPALSEFRRVVGKIQNDIKGKEPVEQQDIISSTLTHELLKDIEKIKPNTPKQIILNGFTDALLGVFPFASSGKAGFDAYKDTRQYLEWKSSFSSFALELRSRQSMKFRKAMGGMW